MTFDMVDELQLLGRFALRVRNAEVVLAPAGERLLAFLALHGGTPRESVAFNLWADHSEERALGCLRSALWRLPKPYGAPLVRCEGSRLRLADHLTVDVRLCRRLTREWPPQGDPPARLDVAVCGEDLLPGWYDEWLVIERERHRQLRLHVLERLSDCFVRQGRYAAAIDAGLCAVAVDPLRESAHRRVVCAHLAEGNISEATRQIEVYLRSLEAAGLPVRLSHHMRAQALLTRRPLVTS